MSIYWVVGSGWNIVEWFMRKDGRGLWDFWWFYIGIIFFILSFFYYDVVFNIDIFGISFFFIFFMCYLLYRYNIVVGI